MITYEKALEIIDFQKQQILDLTVERDRLKNESANASEALEYSNKLNNEIVLENDILNQNIADIIEEVYNLDLQMIGD